MKKNPTTYQKIEGVLQNLSSHSCSARVLIVGKFSLKMAGSEYDNKKNEIRISKATIRRCKSNNGELNSCIFQFLFHEIYHAKYMVDYVQKLKQSIDRKKLKGIGRHNPELLNPKFLKDKEKLKEALNSMPTKTLLSILSTAEEIDKILKDVKKQSHHYHKKGHIMNKHERAAEQWATKKLESYGLNKKGKDKLRKHLLTKGKYWKQIKF